MARNIPIIPSGDKQTGCPWAQGETCEKLRGRRVRSWRFGSCGVPARDALVNFGDRDVVIASGAVDCLLEAVVHAILAGHPGGESDRVRTRIAPRGAEVPVGFSEVVRGEISSASGSGSGSRSSQGQSRGNGAWGKDGYCKKSRPGKKEASLAICSWGATGSLIPERALFVPISAQLAPRISLGWLLPPISCM